MLFLTYHEISAEALAANGLFTVSAETLEKHVAIISERRFESISADDLLVGRVNEQSIILTFDDGTIDHFEIVAPLLERHGISGIFFVPTEKLGMPGRLERQHVKELHDRGHEIGCHSHEHRRMDWMSAPEIANQLRRSCDILGEITGQSPRILAPPGGYTNGRVRTMKWGVNRNLKMDDLETIALHRDFPIARFGKILDGQGLWRLRATYVGKQMLKSLLPINLYEHARNFVFRK